MDLISTTDMKSVSLVKQFVTGKTYKAFDATLGEVEAVYVLLNDEVTVAGAPMYPVFADWDVAGDFLVDEDENVAGVLGLEFCRGSWLGGVVATANYGFVQVKGWNLVTITTDNSVEALDVVLPSTTDGTWLGSDRDELVTDGTNNPATRCGNAPEADGGVTMAAGTVMWDVHLAGA